MAWHADSLGSLTDHPTRPSASHIIPSQFRHFLDCRTNTPPLAALLLIGCGVCAQTISDLLQLPRLRTCIMEGMCGISRLPSPGHAIYMGGTAVEGSCVPLAAWYQRRRSLVAGGARAGGGGRGAP